MTDSPEDQAEQTLSEAAQNLAGGDPMSAELRVDVEVPGIRTWAGQLVAEGSLRVNVPPADVASGHRTSDPLAARAHTKLRAAAAKIAEQDPDNPA